MHFCRKSNQQTLNKSNANLTINFWSHTRCKWTLRLSMVLSNNSQHGRSNTYTHKIIVSVLFDLVNVHKCKKTPLLELYQLECILDSIELIQFGLILKRWREEDPNEPLLLGAQHYCIREFVFHFCSDTLSSQ